MKINTRYYIYLSEWKFFWENVDNNHHHNRRIEFVNKVHVSVVNRLNAYFLIVSSVSGNYGSVSWQLTPN